MDGDEEYSICTAVIPLVAGIDGLRGVLEKPDPFDDAVTSNGMLAHLRPFLISIRPPRLRGPRRLLYFVPEFGASGLAVFQFELGHDPVFAFFR